MAVPVHPRIYIRDHILPKGMTVTKAAQTLGVGRQALSAFLNGKAKLSPKMAIRLEKTFGVKSDGLMRQQEEYDKHFHNKRDAIPTTAHKFVPPFLKATANDIEAWAETPKARDRLAVFLRVLVHSTCAGLKFVDFPGNENAQRPGWDGRIDTNKGSPWVPSGESGWEFGTSQDVDKKANQDYAKRTKSVSDIDQKDISFVFVSPRKWNGKDKWVEKKGKEGRWKSVRAWDASDLEQWLEQSIAAQVWFAKEAGIPLDGVSSLDAYWDEWQEANCNPALSEQMFAKNIALWRKEVLDHLHKRPDRPLRILADSRLEGAAFLRALLDPNDNELAGLGDKIIVFSKAGVLSRLAVNSPGFIAVTTNADVELEMAQHSSSLVCVVIGPQSATTPDSNEIRLTLLSGSSFQEALLSLGLKRDEIARLERESGRSLTVLRRRLSKNVAISCPDWGANQDIAQALLPFALAGAWDVNNEADKFLVQSLAGIDENDVMESRFNDLLDREDAPVWSTTKTQGVLSKIEALYATRKHMRSDQFCRFMDVAHIVLSEQDPALDLPEEHQWAASLYEKSREISPQLRNGIADSLVLLSVRGDQMYDGRLNQLPSEAISRCVQKLLATPLTEKNLRSQLDNLPLYAEAAPELFLSVFEDDIKADKPAVTALMAPVSDSFFADKGRAFLLWALEVLAWNPEWLDRVCFLLADLSKIEPKDRLKNKPSESLRSIFRSWMPQTTAQLDHRVKTFDLLAKRHPNVIWNIAISQFMPGGKTGEYTKKPRWRDYASGFGEPAINDEHWAFVIHCVKACLNWPSYTAAMLSELMQTAERLGPEFIVQMKALVNKWASSASDQDRSWLCEQIRVRAEWTKTHQAKEQQESPKSNDVIALFQDAISILEPKDLVWKHAWLFQASWPPQCWEKAEFRLLSHEAIGNKIRALRLKAIHEVIDSLGYAGVLRLASTGTAPDVPGEFAAKAIQNQSDQLDFVSSALKNSQNLNDNHRQWLLHGFLRTIGDDSAIRIIETLWPECGEEFGIKLLCACSFNAPTWAKAKDFGKSVQNGYWSNVVPTSWIRHGKQDFDYALRHLLNARRAAVALEHAHLNWQHVKSETIKQILMQLPNETHLEEMGFPVRKHQIDDSLSVLNARKDVSRNELAWLEFLHLDTYSRNHGNVPNLELEIQESPEIFCEAVAYLHPRDDLDEQRKLSDNDRWMWQKAYKLVNVISRTPGYVENEVLSAEKLKDWIRRAQKLCAVNGRSKKGDMHIGELLAKSPKGADDNWPCTPVKEVLEEILNEDIKAGLHGGRKCFRDGQQDAYIRGEGGEQERILAAKYEHWAKNCDGTFPNVATTLREIKASFEREAQWRDQEEASSQRRIDY